MELPRALLDELAQAVGPAGLVTDPQALRVYDSDGFSVARGQPQAAVFPTDTAQAARCVGALYRWDVPMVPRGSGTGLAGGAVAFGEGVLVTTTRMTRIESIDLPGRWACVQAGVRNLELTDALAGSGLHFAPDPSSQRASTIGGNAATNAGGIHTLKHGVTTHHVLGVEFILPDGTVHRARAGGLCDGAGPDLTALLCGSEGTLALLTRLWCRLSPRPGAWRTFYAVYPSTADACRTVEEVIASGLLPGSMEMMDGAMIRVVEQAFQMGFPGDAQALLLLELDGVESLLDGQMERVLAIARRCGARDVRHCADPAERARLWSARKRAFGAIGRISPGYCTQDACIPRSRLAAAMDHIAQLSGSYGVPVTNVFHAGDGNIHPVLLFDEHDPAQVQRVLRLSEEILAYCVAIGGTITGEHGVGVEKLHLMPRMFTGPTLDAFNRVKLALDPDRRLNDGKLIPSDRLRIELLRPAAHRQPGGALA